MRIIFCISILFVLSESCLSHKQITQSRKQEECLKNLTAFIERNWRYNKTEDFYEITQAGIDSLKGCIDINGTDNVIGRYELCIENITMEQVEAFFGKAHKKGPWSLMYYNTPNWKVNDYGFTNFTFDTPNRKLRCIIIF